MTVTPREKSAEAEDLGDRSRVLEIYQWITVALGTLASVAWQDRALTLSFLGGGLLAGVNFHLLRKIVLALTGGHQVSRRRLLAQILLKLLGGVGALAMVLVFLRPHPVAFLLGLSTVVVVLILEGVLGLFRTPTE